MKILVTGGAGFLGTFLSNALLKLKHNVLILDNLSNGKKENLPKDAKFYKLDINSPSILKIFQKEKPQIVYHLAAKTNVRESIQDPLLFAKNNILGSINIFHSAQKAKVKKVVFASSIGIYGEPQHLPIKETHPLNPISPYGIEKLTIEKYLNFYAKNGLNFVILRFSNLYGPKQRYDNEGGVVGIFINKILNNEKPIIFGQGKQTRDFLYVEDAVEALIFSLKASPNSIFNVGTNAETKIKNLFKLICQILKKEISPTLKPSRPEEIFRSKVDFSKIKKELGWEPKYNLEEGLKKTIEWFLNHKSQ